MENIITRPATLQDLETLLQFEQGVIAAERPFDTTLKEGHINYYDLAAMITSQNAEVVVAVAENEIIGSGYAKIKQAKDYYKHERYAYLGFMYVTPAYRGKGINQLVLNALTQWAKEKGLTEIRLEVYNDNTPAKNAYIKAGFKPNLIEMRMEIKDSDL